MRAPLPYPGEARRGGGRRGGAHPLGSRPPVVGPKGRTYLHFPHVFGAQTHKKAIFPLGLFASSSSFVRTDTAAAAMGAGKRDFFPPSSHERGDSPLLSNPQKCLCKREENRAEDCEIGRVICFPPHIVWENSSKSPD